MSIFAPKLYKVIKIPLSLLIQYNFDVPDNKETHILNYLVNQQDNLLFRQLRLITQDFSKYNPYIIFVNCKAGKSHSDAMERIITQGFTFAGKHFVISERSASMTRQSILSFVDETVSVELEKRIVMDIKMGKTVLSKWYAYRGLMLSSCHCLENWYPRIIIVPDYETVIPNQTIKYVYDKHMTYEKDGKTYPWVQKDIAVGVRDIKINVFDGCGIHHPDITDTVRGLLDTKSDPTSILWRAPFIKGVTHEMDYPAFFAERGITHIKDVWGRLHDVSPSAEPAIIMCESMYKGLKYFRKYNDYTDWEHYWDMFHKYNHCIGVAKWNFSLTEEPMYTRANYQVLQDLDLNYTDFSALAQTSIDWAEKIISGDPVYLYAFLGLFADKHDGLNPYMEALVKNKSMINEKGVRQYVLSLIDKTIDEMKCGKLYLKACFKFWTPDLIMLMEHIGGLSPKGCLAADEFFTFDRDGQYEGEYLIERNPHICRSEHVILKAVNNNLTDQYCSHLANVCMVNGKSITPQRLNGSDFDGDLVLVIDDKRMMAGVHRDAPIVIDIEDKITVLSEEDTPENKAKVILRDKSNLIGEVSNYATAYHNKNPKTAEAVEKYESYIDLLSVINGKVIDSAKTGVIYNVPRYIAKYGRPLPYFMRYASPYYAHMKKLSRSRSNMNLLCYDIEKWHLKHKYKFDACEFDYTVMMDQSIPLDQYKLEEITAIYLDFCKQIKNMKIQFEDKLNDAANSTSSEEMEATTFDLQAFYNAYRNKCFDICPNPCELANIVVIICYELYPKRRSKRFMWTVGGEGILSNLKQTEQFLPLRDPDGEYEYLGNRFKLEKIVFD